MVNLPSPDFWSSKRVFLTGHTGFKGSWLSLWLSQMGANISGFALSPPTTPNLFTEAGLQSSLRSTIGDIRDSEAVYLAMKDARPDVVIHMAAQPLVRLSYREPIATYATNVMGTVHVLDAVRRVDTVRAVVSVTTDKCYENREWLWGYREDEAMGGHDPYSSSKGCAELVTASYRRSFFAEGAAIASTRAGNVIGGGDWAGDRLVPDILRAFERRESVVVRYPHATRPWQHVLEPLSGYLLLAERLWADGASVAEAWNFGPPDEDVQPVEWIVERMVQRWGDGASWRRDGADHPHEASLLKLDASKAKTRLGWRPRWSLATALDQIIHWHKAWLAAEDMASVCRDQIKLYTNSRSGNFQ